MSQHEDIDDIQCPSCWESFAVPSPPPHELPCELDYDCEVCCRPLVIVFPSDTPPFAQSLAS